MISINNLCVHFTGTYLFKEVSFLINDRDRVGLVGKNGAGKTTLMRIIVGQQEPESGEVIIPKGQTVGYLPQEKISNSKKSVWDESLEAFSEALNLERRIEELTLQITERTDYESDGYMKLVEQLNDANERFDLIGGHNKEANIEKVLLGLGFDKSDLHRPLFEFSGGWQMRVELAKLLLQRPDVLLLDEPTNHLDIESIQWLEEFLTSYSGAVLLVSHDRAFLDNVTNRTVEISLGKIYDYKAGYSDYLVLREEQMATQQSAYENQQRQIADIERFIDRFRAQATKAKQVQSRVKMLEKIDRVEVDQSDNDAIRFRFPPAPRSGKVVFETEDLVKRYGEKTILNQLNVAIKRGEFVALVGKNGEGKTTLAKIITGTLDYEGEARLGHNVSIGYYAQNQNEMLDVNKTVFETIDDVATGDMRTRVKDLLGSFLFRGEDIDKKVKILSGGEKARLAIAKLLLTPVNLLVLDEPTNHLDMRSKDILKSALLNFDGTVVVVSHDRDFLHGLTDRILEFRDKKIKEHLGDVYDFLAARKMERLSELEMGDRQHDQKEGKQPSANKLNYEMRKQLDKEKRKMINQLAQCEADIEVHEQEQARLDAMLASPEAYQERIASGELYKTYDEVKKQLEEKMNLWEDLQLKIEQLQARLD